MGRIYTVIAEQGGGGGGGMEQFIMLLAMMFFIMYFLVFRPQRKEQQKKQEMIDNLGKHDEVITSGGIYGTVMAFKDDNKIVLKVDDSSNAKITVNKAHVLQVVKSKGKGKDKEKGEKDKDKA